MTRRCVEPWCGSFGPIASKSRCLPRPGRSFVSDKVGQLQCAVLVLDIHLGKLSGFDLHDRLTLMGLSIPTIFMTGRDDSKSRERARRVGAKAYLIKPFEDDALIAAIVGALTGTRR